MTTKLSLLTVNYGRELRIGIDIKRKEKIKKVMEFVERIKKVQEKTRVVLKRAQEEMKQQVDRGRKKAEVLLQLKDLRAD